MDRNLKFILILFPVILVSAYIYGLTWDPFTNDVLDGSDFAPTNQGSITTIFCPTGYSEGHVDFFGENTFEAIPSCFSNIISNPLNPDAVLLCGDSFVDAEGMVLTVQCTMTGSP